MSVQNKAAILLFLLFWMFYTKKLIRFASSFSYIRFRKYWYWTILLPQTCLFVNAFDFCDEICVCVCYIINIIIIIIIWNGHLSSMCEHVLLAPLLLFFFFVLNLYLLALAPSIAPLGAIRSQVKSRGFFAFAVHSPPYAPCWFPCECQLSFGAMSKTVCICFSDVLCDIKIYPITYGDGVRLQLLIQSDIGWQCAGAFQNIVIGGHFLRKLVLALTFENPISIDL